MPQLRIKGQRPLHGSLTVSGRKNAALKLMAAALLTDKEVILRRVPDIGDVHTLVEIMRRMGAEIDQHDDTLVINTQGVTNPTIPQELAKKLRASLVLVGPLLARFGEAYFSHPGGCLIGKRSIEPHLQAFRQLGFDISLNNEQYTARRGEHFAAKDIYLSERSVTGTENVLMAAVTIPGVTTISNAAEEEHIVNLCTLLRQLGYKIQGDGTSYITIEGQNTLSSNSTEIEVIPDEIEVGTFAVAAAVTHGEIDLLRVGSRKSLQPILAKFDEFKLNYSYYDEEERLHIYPSDHYQAADVQVNPWPGFPPDLQSPFTVLATQAEGISLIHDWMYEGRLYFVDLLQRMGAEITTCDPHRVLVAGPRQLYSRSLLTPDLRAGAALVLAALTAEGTSLIEHAELIDRGYQDLDGRLNQLGAEITRE